VSTLTRVPISSGTYEMEFLETSKPVMFRHLNTFGKDVSPRPLKESEPVEVIVQEATEAASEVTTVGLTVGLIVELVDKTHIK